MAASPLVLVSGFTAFERVARNPSGAVARALARQPPPGWRVAAVLLPVSFARAPEAWDAFRATLTQPPDLIVALGVSKEATWRLERVGRPQLRRAARPDVDGVLPQACSRSGPALRSGIDLVRLARALRREQGLALRVSNSAGGYVCERLYHHVLQRAGTERVPALFVHVPPVRFCPLARQVRVLRALLALLRDPGYSRASTRRGRPSGSVGTLAAKARTSARKGVRARPM